MKSLRELMNKNFSFQEAVSQLENLVEERFESTNTANFKSGKIEIPAPILQSFILNPDLFKEYLNTEIKAKGFDLLLEPTKVGPHKAYICFYPKNFLKLAKKLSSKKGLNRLIDDPDVVDYLLELIELHPNEWKDPAVNNPYGNSSTLGYSFRSNQIIINCVDNYIRLSKEDKYEISSEQSYILENALINRFKPVSLEDSRVIGRKKESISNESILIDRLKKILNPED